MRIKWKKIMFHTCYVTGITLFSTFGSFFTDQALTAQEVHTSLVSAFIAGGLAFFISFKTVTEHTPEELTKKISNGGATSLEKISNIVHIF